MELCRSKGTLIWSANLLESSLVNGIKRNQNVSGIDCLVLEVLILTDSFTQSLLKKLEALENDFAVHEIRVQNVCAQGEDILSKVSCARGSGSKKDFQKGIGPNVES